MVLKVWNKIVTLRLSAMTSTGNIMLGESFMSIFWLKTELSAIEFMVARSLLPDTLNNSFCLFVLIYDDQFITQSITNPCLVDMNPL